MKKNMKKNNSIFSYEKLLKRLFLHSLLLFAFSTLAQSVPPPALGDYRSTGSGNWTNPGIWQIYDAGGTWQMATGFPGQGTTSANQASYKVIITPGTEITVSSSATYYFGSLYVLANNPVLNSHPTVSSGANVGRINLSGNGTSFKLLGTNQNIYINGGVFQFASNNTVLGLLTGNSLMITNFNGIGATGGLGSNGLQYGNTCTGNQQVILYYANGTTALNYMVCNGSNSDYNFGAINSNGGSIMAITSIFPSAICAGDNAAMFTDYTGMVPNGKVITYTVKLDSGPAGYTFAPITGSFTHPGTAGSIPRPSLENLTQSGNYKFSLAVSYPFDNTAGSYLITSLETASLTVNAAGSSSCACYKDPAVDLSSKYPTKFGITSLGRAGESRGTHNSSWPEQLQGGHIAIESRTAGFVINRVANTNAILIPVEGMIIFDLSENNLKIFTLKAGESTPAWHVFNTPACPTL